MQDDALIARIHEHTAEYLARLESGDPGEAAVRRLHPRARYRSPHPVYDVSVSLILLALKRGMGQIRLVPGTPEAQVQFEIGGAVRDTLTLPQPLHEALAARLKDGANLDVTRENTRQEGHTPLLWSDLDLDMPVTCIPGSDGETVVLKFVLKSIVSS